MFVQTKYGSYTSHKLAREINAMSYKELQQECRRLRYLCKVPINLRSKESELINYVRNYYRKKYDHDSNQNELPKEPTLRKIYNCGIVDGKWVALENIPRNGIMVGNYKDFRSEDRVKKSWYVRIIANLDDYINDPNYVFRHIMYNVVKTTIRIPDTPKCYNTISAIRDIAEGEELIKAWSWSDEYIIEELGHLENTLLSDNRITSRKEWLKWLNEHHPDKNPKTDLELCQEIVARGREIGY